MKVIFADPGEKSVIKEIGSDLKSMQKAVDGSLQVLGPFSGSVCIVYSRDAEPDNLPANLLITNEKGIVSGIIHGSFLVCKKNGMQFSGFAEEELEFYATMFDKDTVPVKFNGKWLKLQKIMKSPESSDGFEQKE